jgi:D-alanine-D-alanine ligase-like ATP-grasp enzyme
MTKPHVAVLMGGWSAEREVSLNSGAACADALESLGYRVTRIDVGRTSPSTSRMAGPARTGRWPASWRSGAFPIPIPASWPRRSPWTRR